MSKKKKRQKKDEEREMSCHLYHTVCQKVKFLNKNPLKKEKFPNKVKLLTMKLEIATKYRNFPSRAPSG